ncbi:MAG TPA: hypothetical protein VHE55_07680 [Fimbriimonadaceae bacterium]|nr:hypothetical protein [Fimbriimonadaceae bacterium]
MRWRKWRWWLGFGLLSLLALGIGLATREGDTLDYLHRRLHVVRDKTRRMFGKPTRVLDFSDPASIVIANLDATGDPTPSDCDLSMCWSAEFYLADGRRASIEAADMTLPVALRGKSTLRPAKCTLYVWGKPKPWLERTWERIKRLVGR